VNRRLVIFATFFSAAVWALVILALWRAFTRVPIPEPPAPHREKVYQHSKP